MYVPSDPGSAPELLGEGKPIPGVTEQQFSDVAAGAATSAKELIENVNKGLNPGQLAGDIHATLIATQRGERSEEHTSELQSQSNLVCRLLLEKKKKK